MLQITEQQVARDVRGPGARAGREEPAERNRGHRDFEPRADGELRELRPEQRLQRTREQARQTSGEHSESEHHGAERERHEGGGKRHVGVIEKARNPRQRCTLDAKRE